MSKPPLALEYIRALRDDRTLSTTEKLAAVMMASHAGRDGTNAHPGIKLLAEEIGLKERQTKTVVGNLARKGWLTQTSSGRGNNRYASVYRLSIPQGATGCTMDAGQGAIDDSQGATGCTSNVQSSADQGATDCPTNQPVEITKESILSQVSDVSDLVVEEHDLKLTDRAPGEPSGQDGSPSASGEAGHEDWVPETPQGILDNIQDLFDRFYKDEWADKPRFDPRFLGKDRAQCLASLAALFNAHRMDIYDVSKGMFTNAQSVGLGPAEHNLDRIKEPAKFLARVLTGDPGKLVEYGERGKKIYAAVDAEKAAEKAAEAAAAVEQQKRRDAILGIPGLFREGFQPKRLRQIGHVSSSSYWPGSLGIWRHESGWAFATKHGDEAPGPSGWEYGYVYRDDWGKSEPVELRAA